jgi:uncharacterized protein YndB with AHSA1/START domain
MGRRHLLRGRRLDPPHRIAYTWRGGAGGGKPLTLDTVVRFTLERVEGGTRLTLDHEGFAGYHRGLLLSFMLGSGWKKMLGKKLPAILEKLARDEVPSGVSHCDHA